MINCLGSQARNRRSESPYPTEVIIPDDAGHYLGAGTIVVTYSNGVSQAFSMNGDDYLIVHAEHTARWI